ncbi:MAG: hypothetical protein KDF65_16760 [Anaerolineae bacterium]|nr:hypothetical protein [Anaerolineae bacterium]
MAMIKGDSKFLQAITGTPGSSSSVRCYFCLTRTFDWINSPQLKINQKPIRYLDNLISTFTESRESKLLARTPCLFPEKSSPELSQFILETAGLWGIEPVFDPLHLIENHSRELFKFYMEEFSKSQKVFLKQKFQYLLKLPLKTSYTGANWRMIWASYTLHLQTVFSELPIV